MIFIFDWGYETTQDIGPLSAEDVNLLIESDFVWLRVSTTWFRLFFIPLIPTGRKYYFSNVDTMQRQAITKNQFDQLKPLAKLNKEAMNEEISAEDYNERRSQL